MIQLHSDNREYFNSGLRVARELPGRATEAVAAAFGQVFLNGSRCCCWRWPIAMTPPCRL